MSINLMCLKANPHFVVPVDGYYLVKTVSETDKSVNGKYKSVNYFGCNVKRHLDTHRNVWVNHFDCNNQKVIAISTTILPK